MKHILKTAVLLGAFASLATFTSCGSGLGSGLGSIPGSSPPAEVDPRMDAVMEGSAPAVNLPHK